MEAAGLVLAVVATADLCLKYGDRLVAIWHSYKHAEDLLVEKTLRAEICWRKARDQIMYVREHRQDFDPVLLDLQGRMFDILEFKLKDANRMFDKLHGKQLRVKWAKFVTREDCLNKAIADLENWQTLFDPSWAMMMQVAARTRHHDNTVASQALEINNSVIVLGRPDLGVGRAGRSIFFATDPLVFASKCGIAYSSMVLAREPQSGKHYIVDTIWCPEGTDVQAFKKNVRALAVKLESVNAHRFSMLECKGAIGKSDGDNTPYIELVFKIPPAISGEPQSMRSVIGTEVNASLTERVSWAQQLAKSICYVHTLDFVHKNVRPESILAFSQPNTVLGQLFLCGYQNFRAADGRTRLRQHAQWHIDLYRHPNRHGERPEKEFIMQHDIYSLGVCLLEIGLWSSFVVYASEEDDDPQPGAILDISVSTIPSAESVKAKLVSMAETRLPAHMGSQFASVVHDCLTCLDPENASFADHAAFEDMDGILIGVKYMERILLELEKISL